MEKEKKGKKITAILIAAALIVIILLCLVRCQSGGYEPDPTETTGATAATTEATGEPATETTEDSEPTTEVTDPSEESTGEPTEEATEAPTEATETTPPATEPGHEHIYAKTTVNPTCTSGGYTLNKVCHCGKWRCSVNEDFYTSFYNHVMSDGDIGTCAYYDYIEWVVDTPASDYYECSVCGATK